LHESGGDGGAQRWAYLYDDHFGVRGFVDCGDGLSGTDGDADGADCNSGRQFDEDCDHGLCAGGDLPGMVVPGGGHNGSDPVLQLDGAGGIDRDGI